MREKDFKPTRSVLFRVDDKMYNQLRKVAHSADMSMSLIIRKSIEKMLKDQNKLLTS